MEQVLVVGAGPVGLTMALELARHGVRCRIIDRLAEPSPYCRAIGVTPRTLEVWDDMGLAREMIEAGLWLSGQRMVMPGHPPIERPVDYPDLPYSALGLPQNVTERLLAARLEGAGIRVERGVALSAFRQDAEGVAVELTGAGVRGEEARFAYLVGCDGAHSTVRHGLGIDFEGEPMPMTFMLGDVHMASDLPYGMSLRALRPHDDAPPDFLVAIPLPEAGRYRVSMVAPDHLVPDHPTGAGGSGHGLQSETAGPGLADLQAVADDLLPDRPRLTDLRWSSIFRIGMRLAANYRGGRAFLAGDAAHIHPPTGGQGMNTGIQDAYNLAWKLALVLRGLAGEALLDSYEAERRPVGADVIARTLAASVNLGREGGTPDRLADTQVLVSYRGGGWVRDDGGEAAVMAGDRMPDATGLRQPGHGFPLRLHDVLRGPSHVLIAWLPDGDPAALADLAAFAVASRLDLRVVGVTAAPGPEHPRVTRLEDRDGTFAAIFGPAPVTILVRPDGYLGWRGPHWRDAGVDAYLDRLLGD